MSTLILILVGAAWLAVLLPPMIKSRLHGSPNNSLTSFRKQMSSFQSSSGRGGNLRDLSRPLAPSQTQSSRRAGYDGRGYASGAVRGPARSRQSREERRREFEVRQRRKNTVMGLAGTTSLSLFVAVTTGSSPFLSLFALSLIATTLYCYWLRQVRIKRDNERYLNRYQR